MKARELIDRLHEEEASDPYVTLVAAANYFLEHGNFSDVDVMRDFVQKIKKLVQVDQDEERQLELRRLIGVFNDHLRYYDPEEDSSPHRAQH